MPSSPAFWPTLNAIVSGGIGFVLDVALLILALTVVRKRSATGATLIAASAALMLLMTIASPLAYVGASRAGDGVDSYLMTSSILGMTLTLVRAAGWVMLMAGIYKTATDGKPS